MKKGSAIHVNNEFISIVTPVYKEADVVEQFVEKLQKVLADIHVDYEVIFALDPSPDETEKILSMVCQNDHRFKLLRFSRKVGQPSAILAGLEWSSGNAVIVMDVDLQDPPEMIPAMLQKWKEGFEVVIPQRRNRSGESWLKTYISKSGYWIIHKIANVDIPPNTGDFRLMSRRVVEFVTGLRETHGFLRGLTSLVGFRQVLLEFDRPPRGVGKSHYNRFTGSMRIGINGVIGFSSLPLTLSMLCGFVIAGLAFLSGLAYFVAKLTGFPFPLGNPTIVILILFLSGIQLISVGIIGEYIGRIYDEVKRRPRFIVESSVGFRKD